MSRDLYTLAGILIPAAFLLIGAWWTRKSQRESHAQTELNRKATQELEDRKLDQAFFQQYREATDSRLGRLELDLERERVARVAAERRAEAAERKASRLEARVDQLERILTRNDITVPPDGE